MVDLEASIGNNIRIFAVDECMEDFYKSFLQNPLLSQLFATNGLQNNANYLTISQQPAELVQPQSTSSGLARLDSLVNNNQENKATNVTGANNLSDNVQRLHQTSNATDSAKMLAAPSSAAPTLNMKSEVASLPVGSTSNGPSQLPVIPSPLSNNQIVKEELRSVSQGSHSLANNINFNGNLNSGLSLPPVGWYPIQCPPTGAIPPEKSPMAEHLRMMSAFGFGFGMNPTSFFPNAAPATGSFTAPSNHPQTSLPHRSSQLSATVLPMATTARASNNTPGALPDMTSGKSEPLHPSSHISSGDSDQIYAQFIQETLRSNMALATASLFSSGSSLPQANATTSPMLAALIAQQIQQFHQQQISGQTSQQATVQHQHGLNDQQKKPDSTRPISDIRSRNNQGQAPQLSELPIKVSTGTSPGVANSSGITRDSSAMGAHERVHYWLYNQSMTAPMSQSLCGPDADSSFVKEPQLQPPTKPSPNFPALSLPPIVGKGGITSGQPVISSQNCTYESSKVNGLDTPAIVHPNPLDSNDAPEAKRPRMVSPCQPTKCAGKSLEGCCSQLPQEDRIKHYEEIIDYVVANAHLMSPPKLPLSPPEVTLGLSTPSYSNSNIAGSLGGASSNLQAINDATVSMLMLHSGEAAAHSPLPTAQVVSTAVASAFRDEVSPSSSSHNSPFASMTSANASANVQHHMPKKAWMMRMYETSNTTVLTSSNNSGAIHPLPDSQFSPSMSTSSSNNTKSPFSKSNDGEKAYHARSPVLPNSLYVQSGPCSSVAPKISKCRECRLSQTNRPQNEGCRFDNFRRLRRTSRDTILCEGFLTLADVRQEDEDIWLPVSANGASASLSPAFARYAVGQMSTEFLATCHSELNIIYSLRLGNLRTLAWRRREDRFRELCDVCQTTLFNLHWFCVKCGFVACAECFQQRQKEIQNSQPESKRWLTCLSANRAKHESDKLLPAVIIPPQCMQKVVDLVRACLEQPQPLDTVLLSSVTAAENEKTSTEREADMSSPLDILAEVAANSLAQTPVKRIPLNPAVYELINDQQLVRFLTPNIGVEDSLLRPLGQELLQLGKPFIVSGIKMQQDWSPDAFASRFGSQNLALVNCIAASTIENATHSQFWSGFACLKNRIVEQKTGIPLCLKMKDWPVDGRFSELMPDHYHDLVANLPMPIYTTPGGALNLASYLPSSFVAPDLGPKVYAAYGTGGQQRVATTSLHLDIADAVNISLYVKPLEDDEGIELKAALDYVENSLFVPEEFKKRCRAGELPGALWHIFDTKDADAIRSYLNQKSGKTSNKDAAVRSSADPIHDQVWYFDDVMLNELQQNYKVTAYTIVQFAGDGVFIPAGCAHQVRNLLSCVKIAIDFVCPERVAVCHKLTDEFRWLPDSHLNHEDKLQLKNILYHAVKEIVTQSSVSSSIEQPMIVSEQTKVRTPAAITAPPSPATSSAAFSDQRSPNLVIELDQSIMKHSTGETPQVVL